MYAARNVRWSAIALVFTIAPIMDQSSYSMYKAVYLCQLQTPSLHPK